MIVGFQIANHRMMEILGSSFLTLIKYTLNSLPLHTINFKKGLRQDNKHSTKCLKNADGSKMTLMLKFAQKCQKCFKNVKNCSKIPFFFDSLRAVLPSRCNCWNYLKKIENLLFGKQTFHPKNVRQN